MAPVSKGLSVDEEIKNFTVTDLLITSDQSYAKKDTTSDNYAKTDEDVPGPLAIAQVVTDSSGEGVLFVSGSSSMGVDEIDDMVSGANISLYSNAVNYMTNEDSKISIKAPSVTNEYAVFSAFATKMIMAIGVIGIPLFLLVLGAVVMLVRRNN